MNLRIAALHAATRARRRKRARPQRPDQDAPAWIVWPAIAFVCAIGLVVGYAVIMGGP